MKYTLDINGIDSATSLLVEQNGAVVIAGMTSLGGESSFSLVRYLSNGSLSISPSGLVVRSSRHSCLGLTIQRRSSSSPMVNTYSRARFLPLVLNTLQ